MWLHGLPTLLLIFTNIVFFQCITADSNNFDDTCNSVVKKNPDIKKDFCQAAIASASNTIGSSTDPTRLADAVTKMAIYKANATHAMLEEYYDHHKTNHDANKCYRECIRNYALAIHHLNQVDRAIRKHNFKKAIEQLKKTVDWGDKCKKAYKDIHNIKPPAKFPNEVMDEQELMDEQYRWLSQIALELVLGLK